MESTLARVFYRGTVTDILSKGGLRIRLLMGERGSFFFWANPPTLNPAIQRIFGNFAFLKGEGVESMCPELSFAQTLGCMLLCLTLFLNGK